MKKDIENIEDIQLLVNEFYGKVKTSGIGYFFNDVANVNWETHLPKMYSFWNSVLFGAASFSGNPMLAHILVDKKAPMQKENFNEWKQLFFETIDEHFEGPKAEEAKKKATNMADLILYKVGHARNNPSFIQ